MTRIENDLCRVGTQGPLVLSVAKPLLTLTVSWFHGFAAQKVDKFDLPTVRGEIEEGYSYR